MEQVSFKVAKALKEAGYSQKYGEGTMCYAEDGTYFEHDSSIEEYFPEIFCIAPTYLDVWLWLWRERGIRIHNEYKKVIIMPMGVLIECENDPEKSIAAAIEYLIDNNLIK